MYLAAVFRNQLLHNQQLRISISNQVFEQKLAQRTHYILKNQEGYIALFEDNINSFRNFSIEWLSRPKNSVIKNILYEFNSMIELNQWGAHVHIENTTFDRISNCGSILRNTNGTYRPEDFNLISSLATIDIQNQILTNNIKLLLEQQQHADKSLALSRPYSCTSADINGSIQCFKVNFINNTFKNFNYMKEQISQPALVNPMQKMQYWGQVLTLNDFDGQVVIQDNIFDNNTIQYKTCEVSKTLSLAKEQEEMTNFQIILNRKTNNRFYNNTSVKALIRLDNCHRLHPVIIYNNTFENNGGYFGATTMFVRARARPNTTLNNIEPSNEASIQCGGYFFYSNIYKLNMGCPQYHTPVFEFNCVNHNSTVALNDDSSFQTFTSDQSILENYKNQTNQYNRIMNFSNQIQIIIGQSVLSLNTSKTEFYDNHYTENYASGQAGIVNFRGLQNLESINERYIRNGDSHSNLLNAYSHLLRPDTSSSIQTLLVSLNTLKSTILYDSGFNPIFINLTISGGFKLTQQKNRAFAMHLYFSNSRGQLHLMNMTLKNFEILAINQSGAVTPLDQSSIKTSQSLIEFSSSYFSRYNIEGLRISNITLKGDSLSSSDSTLNPQIIPSDSGQTELISSSDLSLIFQIPTIIILKNLQILNLTCQFCNNFLFQFASTNLSINNASVQNYNNLFTSRVPRESNFRSGLIGFYHAPDSTQTLSNNNLTLISDSNFTDAHNSIMRIYHLGQDKMINYKIFNSTFIRINTVENTGGVFYVQNINPLVSTYNFWIDSCIFQYVKFKYLTTESTGSSGGIAYLSEAIGLYVSKTQVIKVLQESSGHVFYFNLLKTTQTVVISIEDSNISSDCYQCMKGQFTPQNYGMIYALSTTANFLVLSSRNNYTSNGIKFTNFGGIYFVQSFIFFSNFFENGSTYSNIGAVQGGILQCGLCSQIEFQNSKVYNISSSRGGFIVQANSETNTTFNAKANIISSQFYNVSGLGGLVYAVNNILEGIISQANYEYNITNCTFSTFVSSIGGMLISQASSLLIKNVTYLLNLPDSCQGCFIIVVGGNYTVIIEDSKFMGQGQQGQFNLMYFYDTTRIPTNIVYLKGNNYFGNINSTHPTLGSLISFEAYSLVSLPGRTTIENVQSSIGALQFSWSNMSLRNTTFNNMYSIGQSAVFYLKDTTDSTINVSNCSFSHIYAENSGIIYSGATCTTATTPVTFTNSTFYKVRSRSLSAFGYINSATCKYQFYNLGLDQLGASNRSNQSISNVFTIIEVDSIDFANITVNNLNSMTPIMTNLIYSTSQTATITIMNSNIYCQDDYDYQQNNYYAIFNLNNGASNKSNQSMSNVFTIIEVDSFDFANITVNNLNSMTPIMTNLIYSTSQTATIAIMNSIIYCQDDYDYQQSYYYAIFNVNNGKSLKSYNNKFKNCYKGEHGVFLITKLKQFEDSNSTYENIDGGIGAIYFIQGYFSSTTSVSIKDCVYQNNNASSGLIYLADNLNVQIYNLTFINNTAAIGGVFYLNQLQRSNLELIVQINNTIFQNNTAQFNGGVFMTSHSKLNLTIFNSSFRSSYASQGGAFFNSDIQQLVVDNCSFIDQYADYGVIINSESKNSLLIFKNSKFDGNIQSGWPQVTQIFRGTKYKYQSAFNIQGSNVIIRGSYNTYSNFQQSQKGGIYCIYSATLYEFKSTFQNNFAVIGGVIYSLSGKIYSSYNTYTNNSAIEGGVSYLDSDSYYSAYEDTYQLNSAIACGVQCALTGSQLLIDASRFYNNSGQQDAVLTLTRPSNSNLRLASDYALNFGSFIYISFGAIIDINNATFDNGVANDGGALYLNGLSTLTIFNSIFRNNLALQTGGAIFLSQYKDFTLKNATFQTNKAYKDGASISAYNSAKYKTTFNNVTFRGDSNTTTIRFEEIQAYLTNFYIWDNLLDVYAGAGIRCINCYDFQLSDCLLYNMRATYGGAIYFSAYDISANLNNIYQIQRCNFSNNAANLGGAIYAEDVKRISIVDSNFTKNAAINSSSLPLAGFGGAVFHYCTISTTCISYNMANLVFNLNNAQNSGGCVKWNLLQPTISNLSYTSNFANLYGKNIASFPIKLQQQGTNASSQVSSYLQLPSQQSGGVIPTIYLVFIDHYDQVVSSHQGQIVQLSVSQIQDSEYTVYFEGSQSFFSYNGIVAIRDLTLVGEPGKSYNVYYVQVLAHFNLKNRLNLEAVSNVRPKPGYWRKNNKTSVFIKCYNEDACLGMIQNQELTGECQESYRGVLCADCEYGYGQAGYYNCTECPDNIQNILRIVFILITTVFLLGLFIRLTMRTSIENLNPISIYLKLLLNHVQLIALTQSFELLWPSWIQKYFEISTPVFQATQQIFSVDCMLNIRKEDSYEKSCDNIDGEQRLHSFLESTCYEGPHYFWSIYVAMPSIIFWGLGIPLIAFIILRRNSSKIENKEIQERYGFLYKGYTIKFYYWEIIVLYRKALIAIIATVLSKLGAITQAMLGLIVIGSSAAVNLKTEPFYQSPLNRLESLSLLSSLIAIYSGIFFISDKSEVSQTSESTKNQVELNSQTYILFFILILGSNLVFITYWCYMVFFEIKLYLLLKYEKLYVFFCAFQNSDNYYKNKEVALQQVMSDKNKIEILKKLDKVKQRLMAKSFFISDQDLKQLLEHLSLTKIEKNMEHSKALEAKYLEDKFNRRKSHKVDTYLSSMPVTPKMEIALKISDQFTFEKLRRESAIKKDEDKNTGGIFSTKNINTDRRTSIKSNTRSQKNQTFTKALFGSVSVSTAFKKSKEVKELRVSSTTSEDEKEKTLKNEDMVRTFRDASLDQSLIKNSNRTNDGDDSIDYDMSSKRGFIAPKSKKTYRSRKTREIEKQKGNTIIKARHKKASKFEVQDGFKINKDDSELNFEQAQLEFDELHKSQVFKVKTSKRVGEKAKPKIITETMKISIKKL
ncbi:UNKNOWN [Stylonychia lemnae]|uniref:Transmembrane protein n=1 Tax=Stylonychia lemnae TaxID=5949 RepID=A0A078B1F3_STYLE|nr:UNKNOWN [Stylonychia lemnae]|eukprot:CDW88390.1 UNKNOWN [Stylonychia lemnae]